MRMFFKGAVPPPDEFKEYTKKGTTRAVRIHGAFVVETREGTMTCEDGYLALDKNDDPYPVAADVFEAIYEEVDNEQEEKER